MSEPVISDIKERELPHIWQVEKMHPDTFIAFYHKNKEKIENKLRCYGAVKFKNVLIDSVEDFQYIVDAISSKFLSYIDGNSPRTKLSGNVYTSTEYDKTQKITMHNELSYSAKWPNRLFLSCLQPSKTGGETLLADSRRILKEMDNAIMSKIREYGIIYIRNLHGGIGMGPSWQETFETNDKLQLEAYCKSYKIDFKWTDNNLRLNQFSKGIIQHRETGEDVWFNQIDQFHPIHLGDELYDTIQEMYESEEDFPMSVKYGDGETISKEAVQLILKIISDVTVAPSWGRNELLIVDNELTSHGRNSFTGERKVLVAMSE